jgi:hypothetical protein
LNKDDSSQVYAVRGTVARDLLVSEGRDFEMKVRLRIFLIFDLMPTPKIRETIRELRITLILNGLHQVIDLALKALIASKLIKIERRHFDFDIRFSVSKRSRVLENLVV